MSLPFGFGGRGGLVQFIFGTPIGPRQVTVGDIAGRKAIKSAIKNMMPADADDKKSGEYSPALGKIAFCHLVSKLAELDKEAPFKSEAQRRKFYAMEARGEISKETLGEWENATPEGKLPERLHAKEAGALLGKAIGWGVKKLVGAVPAVAKAGLRVAKPVAKTLFMPSTKMQGAVGAGLWGTHTGVTAAKNHQPMAAPATISPMKSSLPQVKQVQPLQMAASEMIEFTKQALMAGGLPSQAGNWLKRSTTGTTALNVGKDAPKGLEMAGNAGATRAGAGPTSHIQKG